MPPNDVLYSRLAVLREIVRARFEDGPAQVQGFVARVLKRENRYSDNTSLYRSRSVEECLETVRFDGYPALARSGYCLGGSADRPIDTEQAERFLRCLEQQHERPAAMHAQLAGDTICLLGIADGLRTVSRAPQPRAHRLEAARVWVQELLDKHGGADPQLNRARLLASDLLDEQERFGRRLAQSGDARAAALDLCLWRSWKGRLQVEHPDVARRRQLFKALLVLQPPGEEELLHAATWLCALDVLSDAIAEIAVPDASKVSRILAGTQGSFRRWRWEENVTRDGAMPARWLIDKEAHVQAFLLAVLYPYFVDQLEDEQYLRGFGLRQGRFDFAITTLGLIVEVKMVRKAGDLNKLEAEIADDLALYFKDGNPFRNMIVYIYDDMDKPEPEKYPTIRDALKRRSERIVDVVIVQRPSMIPDRDKRRA